MGEATKTLELLRLAADKRADELLKRLVDAGTVAAGSYQAEAVRTMLAMAHTLGGQDTCAIIEGKTP